MVVVDQRMTAAGQAGHRFDQRDDRTVERQNVALEAIDALGGIGA